MNVPKNESATYLNFCQQPLAHLPRLPTDSCHWPKDFGTSREVLTDISYFIDFIPCPFRETAPLKKTSSTLTYKDIINLNSRGHEMPISFITDTVDNIVARHR
jgi:hypothetical protein